MRPIDADAFKDYIKNGIDGLIIPRDQAKKVIAVTKSFLKDIDEQPTIEVRPHGEWVLDQEFSFVFNIYECSKCRFNGSKRWHFCPSCGADMRKEGEPEC